MEKMIKSYLRNIIEKNPQILDHIHTLKEMGKGNPQLQEQLLRDFMTMLVQKLYKSDPSFFDGYLFDKELEQCFITNEAKMFAQSNFVIDLHTGEWSDVIRRLYGKPPENSDII